MRDRIHAILLVVFIVLIVVGTLVWYSHVETGRAVINTKWVETHIHESCSGGDNGEEEVCTTSTSYEYMVQFDDGRVYDMFWGQRDWDQLRAGYHIDYEARGHHVELFGRRIGWPSIMSFRIRQ